MIFPFPQQHLRRKLITVSIITWHMFHYLPHSWFCFTIFSLSYLYCWSMINVSILIIDLHNILTLLVVIYPTHTFTFSEFLDYLFFHVYFRINWFTHFFVWDEIINCKNWCLHNVTSSCPWKMYFIWFFFLLFSLYLKIFSMVVIHNSYFISKWLKILLLL